MIWCQLRTTLLLLSDSMKPKVTIGGIPVNIDSNIQVVLRSPVFPEQDNTGSYVFNFSLQPTNDIKRLLGWGHRPGAPKKVFHHEMTISVGSFKLRGLARITSINQTLAEASMPIFNGAFARKLEGLNLNEIETQSLTDLLPHIARAQIPAPIHNQFTSPTSGEVIENDPIPFSLIIEDSAASLGPEGKQYSTPADGSFTIHIELDVNVIAGNTPRLIIRKNGQQAFIKYLQQGQQTFSHSLELDLLAGDIIDWVFSINYDQYSFDPYDPDYGYSEAVWEYNPQSMVSVFSPYPINDIVNHQYPQANYAIGPIFNDNFFAHAGQSKFLVDSQDLQFINEKFPVINYFKNGKFPVLISGEQEGDQYSCFNTISPLLYLPYVITKLFETLGIEINNNVFESPEINQLCIYANNSLNRFDLQGANPIRDSFNLSDMLPPIPASEFFKDVCKTLGIVYSFNEFNNTLILKTIDSIIQDHTAIPFSNGILTKAHIDINTISGFHLKYEKPEDPFVSENYKNLDEVNLLGSVSTLSELPHEANPNDCFLVEQESAYYYYGLEEETNNLSWLLYTMAFSFDIKHVSAVQNASENLLEIVLPCPPMMMRTSPKHDPTWGNHRDWVIPATKRPGRLQGTKKADPDYYLLFYRGLIFDSFFELYPYLSNQREPSIGGVPLPDPLDLSLTHEDHSLYKKRFHRYLTWRTGVDGTHRFIKDISTRELAEFDFLRWYNILGMDYLIQEIRFEITPRGISPAEIIAMPRAVIDQD